MPLVLRKELEDWLNEYLNINQVSDYLPNGLQVEGADRISCVTTAVSINLDIIESAVNNSAQAIVVHHGLFWKSDEPRITGYRKKRIKSLLMNDINLFAYHLPLDFHPEISHNRLILRGLGILDGNINIPSPETGIDYGLLGEFNEPLSFKDLVGRLNSYLGCKSKYFNYGSETVKKVAVVSGAGRTLLDKVIDVDVDAYITGDAQENTEYICKEAKINYIYAGHYNTEKPGIIALGEKIKKEFGIDVIFVNQENLL